MVSHNQTHRSILRNQLGKSVKHRSAENLAFLNDLMYNINMGYVDPEKMTPHSSVGYFREEQKFYHPWSIDELGRTYEYGKIKDFMTLKDYLELPAHLVDGLLKGMHRGRIEYDEEIKRLKKLAQEQQAQQKGNQTPPDDVMTPEQLDRFLSEIKV